MLEMALTLPQIMIHSKNRKSAFKAVILALCYHINKKSVPPNNKILTVLR
jgi:hypothetical protein